MKKLYEKNEVLFAVGAIVIYVVAAGTARGNFGDDSPWMLAVLAALTAALGWFLAKNQLLEKYGLTFWPESRRFLYFIPFGILAVMNLRMGIRPHYGPMGQVLAVLSMGLVGFLEELIFRGFLFRAIEKESHTRAVVISAVTFGAGHIVNLLTGQATAETAMQILYATAIGFAFVTAYDRGGSLWPCVLTHSLVNITSKFSNEQSPLGEVLIPAGAVLIIVLSAAYTVYMVKKCPKRGEGGLRP